MPMGMLEHHLARLQQAALIAVRHETHKRYFPADTPPADRRLIALLRQEAPRRICLALLEAPDRSHGALLRVLPYRRSTLSHHLERLVAAGIVARRPDGRLNLYALLDPHLVHAVLVRYAPTFLDRLLDGFLAAFELPPKNRP